MSIHAACFHIAKGAMRDRRDDLRITNGKGHTDSDRYGTHCHAMHMRLVYVNNNHGIVQALAIRPKKCSQERELHQRNLRGGSAIPRNQPQILLVPHPS